MRRRLPHFAAFCLVAALYLAGALEFIEYQLFDLRFRALERSAQSDLVIVAIDPKSISEIGVWPWPRELHADLVDDLIGAGARQIALDIDFSSRSNTIADARLAGALDAADRRVILPVFRQISQDPAGKAIFVDTAPLPAFAGRVRLASINVRPEVDGLIRRMQRTMFTDEVGIPSLSVLLTSESSVSRGPFYIDYSIDLSMIPQIPFIDVIRGEFSDELFAGKTVLVGATAVELGDILSVPVFRALPGVFVQAAAYETLVQGRGLSRLPAALALAFALMIAVLVGPRLVDWHWLRSGLVALNIVAGLFVSSLLLQKFAPYSLDIAPGVLVSILSFAFALVLVINNQTWRIFTECMSVVHRRATLEAVVERSFDGILSVGHDGKVRSINPAAARIFDCREQDAVGIPIQRLLPQFDGAGEDACELMEQAARAGIAAPPAETLAHRHSGGEFSAEVSISRTELALGNRAIERRTHPRRLYLLTVRDITQRKRSEVLKNEFISTVSHELRTPLTSIGGALGLLVGGAAGVIPAEADRLIGIAKNNSDRLIRLINDILDLKRIESAKLNIRREPIQLASVLNAAIVENQGIGDDHDGAFRLTAVDPGIVAAADADRLTQVMTNLLSNAAKFSPKHSTVDISTWRRGNVVRVSVTDHGPGIPEEFAEHIFEKFSQADASSSRNHGGTGLGLSIVKALVEGMGGRVGFESDPGEGTTFYFDLPLWLSRVDVEDDNVVALDAVEGRRTA